MRNRLSLIWSLQIFRQSWRVSHSSVFDHRRPPPKLMPEASQHASPQESLTVKTREHFGRFNSRRQARTTKNNGETWRYKKCSPRQRPCKVQCRLETSSPQFQSFVSFFQDPVGLSASLINSRFMDDQLVRSDNGHRNRRSIDGLGAFSHPSSLLSVHCLLSTQRGDILVGVDHLHPTIYPVSRNLASHDPRPDQLPLPGHGPHGVRNAHRDVGLDLCSAMGSLGHVGCMGTMDDGCHCGSLGHSFSLLRVVCSSPLNIL